MGYTRSLISFIILTMFVGLGSLFLVTDQASAGFDACSLGIEKVADPADDTPFEFFSNGGTPLSLTLTDPSNDAGTITEIFNNSVSIVEDVPEGWSLDDIVCSGPAGVVIMSSPQK